jgi:hypothetical protein
MAFRYLSWILFPLLGCYAVYSLLYLEHKGWYSWVLSMLYGFLLTFGEGRGRWHIGGQEGLLEDAYYPKEPVFGGDPESKGQPDGHSER